jgi:hypothetical protein
MELKQRNKIDFREVFERLVDEFIMEVALTTC